MTNIVPIGEGRFVEMTEGEPKAPPPVPAQARPGRKRSGRPKPEKTATRKTGPQGSYQKASMSIPGYSEWLSLRTAELAKVSDIPGAKRRGRRPGTPDGMSHQQADKHREAIRLIVERDLQNMKDAGLIDPNDEHALEAMRVTLEVMREEGDRRTKLAAARQVLEWTKAKPASKTEMTVNTAEAWLDQIAAEANPEE